MHELHRLSNGAYNAARDCKRKFHYRYGLGLQRRGGSDSAALNYGKLWHMVLAWCFKAGRSWRDDVDVVVYGSTDSDDNAKRCLAMLDGYAERWPMVQRMSLHEQEIDVHIRNPETGRRSQRFTQFGFLDMLALHDDGKVWLWEHKTAASIGGGYLEKLFSDSQITGYVAALRDMGIDIEGVVYDVALKPKIRIKKKETEEEFYARLGEWHMQPEAYHREEVYVSDRQIADWRRDVWAVTQDLLNCRRTGNWYRNTSRCFDYYRPCEYVSLCQNGAPEALINSEYELRESPAKNDIQTTEKPVF